MKNVCSCRSCVDPRESGLFRQHGLPFFDNGIYMSRSKGAFVPRPSPHHDVSAAGVMLVQMNDRPTFIVQGHRDCAAVHALFASYGKKPDRMNDTEREFHRSYGDTLKIVKKIAAALPEAAQLRILEKLCVLQGVNNLFSYEDLHHTRGYHPAAHAYYSLTPLPG